MYAEMELLFPTQQGFPQETHPLPEELLCLLQGCDVPVFLDNGAGDMVQNACISDYHLGAEDLFKAPEPIIEEPAIELDPLTAALSMMSNDDDALTVEAIKVVDTDPIQSEQLWSGVLSDCNDLLARCATEDTFSELSDDKTAAPQVEEEKNIQNNESVEDGPMQKSVSAGSLTMLDWSNGGSVRPNFLDMQGMSLRSVIRMRRTYSEGDIQTLGNGGTSHVNPSIVFPPSERLLTIPDHKIEERWQKISRYMKKKTKRNFGRKIKYACRKALADSQPRVRGRFAKAEECEASK